MIGLQTDIEKVDLFIFQFRTNEGAVTMARFFDSEEAQFEGFETIGLRHEQDFDPILKEARLMWGVVGESYWAEVLTGQHPKKKLVPGIVLPDNVEGMAVTSTLSEQDCIDRIVEGLEYHSPTHGLTTLGPQESISIQVTTPYISRATDELKAEADDEFLNAALMAFGMDNTNISAQYLSPEDFETEEVHRLLACTNEDLISKSLDLLSVFALMWSDTDDEEYTRDGTNFNDFDALFLQFEDPQENKHWVCLIATEYTEKEVEEDFPFVQIARHKHLHKLFPKCFSQVCVSEYRRNCEYVEESIAEKFKTVQLAERIISTSFTNKK